MVNFKLPYSYKKELVRTLGAALHEGSAFLEKGARDLCELLGGILARICCIAKDKTDLDLIRHFASKRWISRIFRW
jgi:hypothetical protein